MSALRDFLARMTGHLDAAGVPYMLAGSLASTFHGTPRTTQDVDIVLELGPGSLRRLFAELDEEAYYVSKDAALDAVRRQGQFNVIDMRTGWKADLIVRKDRPFSEMEFGRRVRTEVLGIPVWLATAEDTVIAKLEWAQKGGSERQLRDVAGILELRAGELDRAYIERWCGSLGLDEPWRRAREMASGPG